MSKVRLVDLEVFVHHDRPKAVLVSLDGDRAKAAVWLPKEPVEFNGDVQVFKTNEITLPEDLALEKGLI